MRVSVSQLRRIIKEAVLAEGLAEIVYAVNWNPPQGFNGVSDHVAKVFEKLYPDQDDFWGPGGFHFSIATEDDLKKVAELVMLLELQVQQESGMPLNVGAARRSAAQLLNAAKSIDSYSEPMPAEWLAKVGPAVEAAADEVTRVHLPAMQPAPSVRAESYRRRYR
jgi:hypothetical protein